MPTSTTVEPADEDYEAVRERFYAEGWDEGRKRQRRGAPNRTAFRTWYGEEIPTGARGDDGKAKDEGKPQAKAKPEPAKVAQPQRQQPKATDAQPKPRVAAPPKPAEKPAPIEHTAVIAVESEPTKAASTRDARPRTETRTPGESQVSEETTEAAPKEPAPKDQGGESEPLIRIAMPAEHVALLTLNTPKIRNALTAEMRLALRGALKNLAADDRVHALVITGADGNFCAGGDVRTMGETDPYKIRQRMTEVAETAEALASFPKPVIAAVAGHAAGAGVSLACLADIIVVDESTQFTFSFLRLALGPDWGLSWSLPRRVGATKARGLILSRGVIDAREAQQIGLADHFASEGETQIAAIELAKKMCNGPREATAAVKTMLSDLDGLRAALDAEIQMQLERFPSWEHQEGAKAFKEKRAADYTRRPE